MARHRDHVMSVRRLARVKELEHETLERVDRRYEKARREEQEKEEAKRAKIQERRMLFEKELAKRKAAELAKKRELSKFQQENRLAAFTALQAQHDAQRKELDRMTREAVESKELFYKYNEDKEREDALEARKKEMQQRARDSRLLSASPEPTPEEIEKRKERHTHNLIHRFGMILHEEQVGAVTLMCDRGVPIMRDGSLGTVAIGDRRRMVKVERVVRGRYGENDRNLRVRIGDQYLRENFHAQLIPEGKWMPQNEGFAGAYRVRVRYTDVKLVMRTNEYDVYTWEASGTIRKKPMVLTVKGSDGYVAVWTESPIEGTTGDYCGVLETDRILEANFGVQDTLCLQGWKEQAKTATVNGKEVPTGQFEWKEILEEINIDFSSL